METGLVLKLLLLIAVGFAVGLLYFLGLWWTLKGLPADGGWTGRFVGSFVLRAAFVVAVFYLLMGNDWRRIFALILGFMVARFVMVRRIRELSASEGKEQAA